MHNICSYVFKEMIFESPMECELTPGLLLLAKVVGYLNIEDAAKTRPVNKDMKLASEQHFGAWRAAVKSNVHGVKDCAVCNAMVRTRGPLNTLHKSVEWCNLCEHIVCTDHLQRCNTCANVFCCVCTCC